MEKKKVLQFIHGLSMGGAETLVKEYCLGLNKEKYDVSVLCFYKYHTPYEKLLEDAGIKVTYIDDIDSYLKSKINKILLRVLLFFKRILLVCRYVKREQPDIIHTHLNDNTYIWTAMPKQGTKIFHTVHNELEELWDGSIEGNIDLYASKKLIKKYHMRFITLHDEMRIKTDEFFNVSDSVVLNNGIDFTKFEKALSKEEIRKKEGIPLNAFVLGHVGRFNKQKNQSFIIDIFAEIVKKNPKAYLLMIGNGATLPEIEEKIKELKLEKNCKILSYRTDIPDLLNAMDLFVFPSLFEGLGIVLVEAQKMKLPCVASDAVPEAAVLSNLVRRLSLNLTAKQWAKEILNFKVENIEYYGLEEWDMKRVIQKLEAIYDGTE